MYRLAEIKRVGSAVALTVLILSLGITALLLLLSQQAASSYVAASACTSPAETGSDCYQVVSGQITSASYLPNAGGSSSLAGAPGGYLSGTYTVSFSTDEKHWTTKLTGDRRLLAIKPGDQIRAKLWRGAVTEIMVGSAWVRTVTAPWSPPGGYWLPLAMFVVFITLITATAIQFVPRRRRLR